MSAARQVAGHRSSAMSPLPPSTARKTFSAASTSAGGDHVRMRPVQVAEADAVVRYLRVVRAGFVVRWRATTSASRVVNVGPASA